VAGDNDNLVFDNTGSSTIVSLSNDVNGLSLTGITFTGSGTGSFSLAGDDINISGGITDSISQSVSLANNIDFTQNQTLGVATGATLQFSGAVSGSANLAVSGGGQVSFDNPGIGSPVLGGYSGALSSADSQIELGTYDTFTSSGSVAVSGTGTLSLFDENGRDGNVTFDLPVSLGGVGSDGTNALNLTGGQGLGVTLSGPVSLTSNVSVVDLLDTEITLNLTGHVTYNGYSISSGSPNVATVTVPQGDDQSSENPTIGSNVVYDVDGTLGNTTVASNATLEGDGSVGALDVENGGTAAPGHSPGCLNSGNLTLNGVYQIQLGGTTACSGYDQLNVTGTVNVTGATPDVVLYDGFAPKVGDSFTIINNDGSDPVIGTFSGLPGGTAFASQGVDYRISYKGGTGNDVVLTVVSSLSAPNTGFTLITAHPWTSLILSTVAASTLLFTARRLQPAINKKR
jgi:hypothetical protein